MGHRELICLTDARGWWAAGTHTLALAVCAILVHASVAVAQSPPPGGVCVVCTEPLATYECVLPPKLQAHAGGNKIVRRGLHLACLSEIAKVRGHKRCGARRGKAGPCTGLIHTLQGTLGDQRPPKVVTGKSGRATPAPTEKTAPAQNGAALPEPRREQAETEDAPPKTMQELAEQATEKTGQQLDDAGKAIGNAAKKSWTCLTSLFSNC
ncbi:MAG: hypothetical protein AAFO62_07585 [Pseudomonadota bacterium]